MTELRDTNSAIAGIYPYKNGRETKNWYYSWNRTWGIGKGD